MQCSAAVATIRKPGMVGDDPGSSRAVSRFGVRLRFDAGKGGVLDGCGMVGQGMCRERYVQGQETMDVHAMLEGRGFTELGV